MDRIFRSLVLISLALFVLWWSIPYLEPYINDDPDTLYLWQSSGLDATFLLPNWYYYLWFAFWIIAYFGLFFRARWARTVFVVGYGFSFLTVPFSGTVIQSPWSSIVGSLATLSDGAIIAMMFLTSVAQSFDKKAT